LQSLRGVDVVTAVVLAAEIGDFKRFRSPKQLMAYLGLVPSEHSSGGDRRQGGITRTGNRHARWVLVEAAWNYRFRPCASQRINARRQRVSAGVRTIAQRAEQRLSRRFRRLIDRGKSSQKAVTAVARELVGFVWAIAQEDTLLAA
jgi:transposase